MNPGIAYIQELYRYGDWANRQTFEAAGLLSPEFLIRDLHNSFGSVLDTLAHIVAAEWIWLERWHGHSPPALPKTAEFGSFHGVKQRLEEVRSKREDWLSAVNTEDLVRGLTYRNLRGQANSYPLWQQLAHVVNHSTYHRGQITTMLRQLGAAPAATDLLLYYDGAGQQRSATA